MSTVTKMDLRRGSARREWLDQSLVRRRTDSSRGELDVIFGGVAALIYHRPRSGRSTSISLSRYEKKKAGVSHPGGDFLNDLAPRWPPPDQAFYDQSERM